MNLQNMKKSLITVVGIGPGSMEDITPAVMAALQSAEVVIGYKYYFQFVKPLLLPDAVCIDTGMRKEQERAQEAFEQAESGKQVCVISSGDSGIYGMAPLLLEMQKERKSNIEINVLPGITAFQKAASLLGAPMGHDFCVISMSDLMTPWSIIEKRIRAAAAADFITAVYNPKSEKRYWQLNRLREIFLKEGRSPETVVGYVHQAGRADEHAVITTLSDLDIDDIDMFTIVIIGNSQSFVSNGQFITPRGYYRGKELEDEGKKIGQQIMIESFKTIAKELKDASIPLDRKWPLLHAIHTTADFEMEQLLLVDNKATEDMHRAVTGGRCKTIITDVTMAASGIRKGALSRLGVEVKCYLDDPRVAPMAQQLNITRTQAGIRLAVEEHPDAIYVFGNAPTALMELCQLMRNKKANPTGIIAAPVGFVHVCESKHMVKTFTQVPKIIVDGRKGGSNLAATLVNAVLTYDDAQQLLPGRDL